MRKSNGLIVLLVILVFLGFVWVNGGREMIIPFLPNPAPQPQPEYQNTPTPHFDPAPPDPTKNAPDGGDFLEYVETLVPTEMKEQVDIIDLFDKDKVKANQYFDLSVYADANTRVEVYSAARARSANTYSYLVWPDKGWTRLIGKNGEVLKGSELTTNTIGDMFMILGTTQGHALDGISDIKVSDDQKIITVTSKILLQGMHLGLAVSAEDNKPQVEHSALVTPDPPSFLFDDDWLNISEKIPSESVLNNIGLSTVSKEATWLLLHKDGNEIWRESKESIENPGNNSAYDLLAPYVREAFCKKLDTYQTKLLDQGFNLDVQSCGKDVEIRVVLIAIHPTSPTGSPGEGIEYLTMLNGQYVQTPGLIQPVED